VRDGSPSALAILFRRHGAVVFRVAHAITRSTEDAEDVTQEVFVSLPGLLHRYVEANAFPAWLRVTAARKALDTVRRDRRRPDVRLEDAGATGIAPENITRIALEDAVNALPDTLRRVFLLRAVGGYPHSEIAAMLGISRNATEVRYFRAIRLLRKGLQS
jgi:RNA polymerase sigma-70 factor, ECF subfamily